MNIKTFVLYSPVNGPSKIALNLDWILSVEEGEANKFCFVRVSDKNYTIQGSLEEILAKINNSNDC